MQVGIVAVMAKAGYYCACYILVSKSTRVDLLIKPLLTIKISRCIAIRYSYADILSSVVYRQRYFVYQFYRMF